MRNSESDPKLPIMERQSLNTNVTQRFFLLLKYTVVFGVLLLNAIPAMGQTRHTWWYTLEQGKQSFRDGAYGSALLSFEDARRQRRAMYEQMEKDLIDLLSLPPVRRLDDALDKVETFARERLYDDAAAALDEAYYRYPKNSFNNSAKAVLEALNGLKNYPEAEYWIGETYRREGELTLAVLQYEKAWEQRSLLEQSSFGTDLLYKIADIRKMRQEYNEMERTLQQILIQDSLWSTGDSGKVSVSVSESSAQLVFARNAMTKTLENEGINRFLTLYRYINAPAEYAHRLLGLYYYASGRYSRAQEHFMFAFLMQNSVIIEEVIRHEYDFTFTSLEALSDSINRNTLIAEYMENVDYYRTVYYLALSLYGNGKTAPARSLWLFLSGSAPSGEWQNRARLQLRQPYVEPVVEMP